MLLLNYILAAIHIASEESQEEEDDDEVKMSQQTDAVAWSA